jgi:hypothetical protein
MKPIYVASWAIATVLCGCAVVNAQTPPRAAAAPMAPGVTAHPETRTETDPNQPADKVPDPETPTAGHDDATGKNLISPDSTQAEKANTKHPDFITLDPNHRGYLTLDDVKNNKWLGANFARCDANHDGHLSQQEYANCK